MIILGHRRLNSPFVLFFRHYDLYTVMHMLDVEDFLCLGYVAGGCCYGIVIRELDIEKGFYL